MIHINHYIPSLGSSTSGHSFFCDTIEEAKIEIKRTISFLKPGEKIVITMEEY